MKIKDIPIGGGFRLNPEFDIIYIRSGEEEFFDPLHNTTNRIAANYEVFPAELVPVTVTFLCMEIAQYVAGAVDRSIVGNCSQSHGEVIQLSAMKSLNEVLEDPIAGWNYKR
jgi:hypothetical protein